MNSSTCPRQCLSAVHIITLLPRSFFILWFVFVLGDARSSFGQQQDQIKVVAYNLLNYPAGNPFTADTSTRNPYYRTTISSLNPDILVVEEMNSQAGVNGFLSNVMNASSSAYSAGVFIDGTFDTENALFYKSAKFHFVSNRGIKTALRDISEFTLTHLLSGDTIRIYAVHLKASATPSDEQKRASEVDSLRKVTNALPLGSNFIVCGDFNFYSSTEPAYLKLLHDSIGVEGHFIDPITMNGSWNNVTYSIRHTQSTRVTTYLNDGGSTGGLDDRFDLILYSKAISLSGGMTYVANSTIAYGNDGNHYNDSINKMPNSAVSQAIAEALYHSSDHLPIVASFNFQYGSQPQPDLGVLSLVTPGSPICSNANQTLTVQVKNFGTADVNFSSVNLQVLLSATNPSSSTQNFSKTISSGTLIAGATMNVTFDTPYNMSTAGNYLFNSNTVITGDANNSNNAMPPRTVVVNSNPTAAVSPPGPISFCSGSSATLTASTGTGYLWSTGATTQSITVSTAGSYSVTVTANGCSSTSSPVVVSITTNQSNGTVFIETMDSVLSSNPVSISSYETSNGFTNDNLFMSGNGDVRNTSASSGYAGASAAGNVFLTSNTSGGRNFIISGINTSGLANLQLSFGIFKSQTAATGSDFSVMVSSDGVNYTNLSYPALPTNSATWYYRTATGTIPAVPNLRIQFKHDSTIYQYRIDDIKLVYSGNVPVITASGPTTFCQGDSVTLTASSGSTYLWSNGATTQSIKVFASGSYSVTVDCLTSSTVTVTVNTCSVTLNLKLFLEGYYLAGEGQMQPVLYNDGLSTDTTACDTIAVELHDVMQPDSLVATSRVLLHKNGNAQVVFPGSIFNHSYYLVIRHRSAVEIWSKYSILFNSSVINFDFTSQ